MNFYLGDVRRRRRLRFQVANEGLKTIIVALEEDFYALLAV
jgi:hypothetical protein